MGIPFDNSFRNTGDPPADKLIERIIAENGPDEARKIFDLLIKNLDIPLGKLPEYVREFVETQSLIPEWADMAKIKTGESVFAENGPSFLIMLYFRSLPFCYLHKTIAGVLTNTGRLAYDPSSFEKFSRRIAETGQFLLDVVSEEGFRPGGRAIQTILRVRLIHASIRYFLIHSGKWEVEKNGIPINQQDLAFTLTTFGVCITDGMKKFGRELNQEELESYNHLWNVAGSFLGIDLRLLPANSDEARKFQEKIISQFGTKTEDGQILTQALLRFAEKNIPLTIFDNAAQIIMRDLCGEKYSEMLGLKKPGSWLWKIFPNFIRKWIGWIRRIEDSSITRNILLDKLGAAVTKGAINWFDTYKNRKMELPKSWFKK